MIRLLTIIILFGSTVGGVYYLFSTEINVEDIKVTGTLQISEQYGKNNTESSSSSYFAVVEGKIKNQSNKPLKNIFIKYSIGEELTSATVFDLAPGQELKFNTRGVSTDLAHPEYNFVGLNYE